jgi:hypothetical protein
MELRLSVLSSLPNALGWTGPFTPQGLKPRRPRCGAFPARLKPCPDTEPQGAGIHQTLLTTAAYEPLMPRLPAAYAVLLRLELRASPEVQVRARGLGEPWAQQAKFIVVQPSYDRCCRQFVRLTLYRGSALSQGES